MRWRSRTPNLVYLLCCVIPLLSLSCAHPCVAPNKQFVRTMSRPVTEADELVVVVDTCVTMDRLKDYVSVEDSRAIESYMAAAATSYLGNIGYMVSMNCTPFVGSFKSADETFHVKQQRKDKADDIHPPFFTETGAPEDAAWQESLARVIRETMSAVGQNDQPPADRFRANQAIREDLKVLQGHFQKRYVAIVIGDGKSVPGLTSFSQGMVTGMATGMLTGGLVSVSVYDVTYLDTTVGIIDLSEGDLLWSNSLRLTRGKICKEKFYSMWNERQHTYDGWVHTMFFYVPVKGSKLIEAAQNGKNDCLKWMLQTNPSLNEGDADQMTPLHWACPNGHLQTLELLAKGGADVNCQDSQGDTPLHYAARTNQPKMVTALLKRKADIHTKNNQGESPLDVATSSQDTRIVKMLRKYDK